MYGFTQKEARAFTRRVDYTREAANRRALLIVLVLVLVATFIQFAVLPVILPAHAKAQQTGPMTNKEMCQDIKAGLYIPPVGHLGDTVKLCAREGVRL